MSCCSTTALPARASATTTAAIRVPLTIAGPGLQRGATVDRFVQHEDLFPTILELAGVAPPKPRTMGPYLRETPATLTGRSLLPLCRGAQPAAWRDAAYIESYNNISTATPAQLGALGTHRGLALYPLPKRHR